MRQVTIYTQETKNMILKALRGGSTVRHISKHHDIPISTIATWAQKAKKATQAKQAPAKKTTVKKTPKRQPALPSKVRHVLPDPCPDTQFFQGGKYPADFVLAAQKEMERGVSVNALAKGWGLTSSTLRKWRDQPMMVPEPSLDNIPPEFRGDPGVMKTPTAIEAASKQDIPTFVMNRGVGFEQSEESSVEDDLTALGDKGEEETPTTTRQGYRQPTNLAAENKKLREIIVTLSLQVHELQTR